jgi:hypothetical protein
MPVIFSCSLHSFPFKMPFPAFLGLHPRGSHCCRKQGDDKVTDNIDPGTRAQATGPGYTEGDNDAYAAPCI